MKPIMASASCDLLALCLSAGSIAVCTLGAGLPTCSKSVHFPIALVPQWIITGLLPSYTPSQNEWIDKPKIFEYSFPLYSKLVLTCACAAFMAPPWIWCKDHLVRRWIMAEAAVWATLLISELPFRLLWIKTTCLIEFSPLCNGRLPLSP